MPIWVSSANRPDDVQLPLVASALANSTATAEVTREPVVAAAALGSAPAFLEVSSSFPTASSPMGVRTRDGSGHPSFGLTPDTVDDHRDILLDHYDSTGPYAGDMATFVSLVESQFIVGGGTEAITNVLGISAVAYCHMIRNPDLGTSGKAATIESTFFSGAGTLATYYTAVMDALTDQTDWPNPDSTTTGSETTYTKTNGGMCDARTNFNARHRIFLDYALAYDFIAPALFDTGSTADQDTCTEWLSHAALGVKNACEYHHVTLQKTSSSNGQTYADSWMPAFAVYGDTQAGTETTRVSTAMTYIEETEFNGGRWDFAYHAQGGTGYGAPGAHTGRYGHWEPPMFGCEAVFFWTASGKDWTGNSMTVFPAGTKPQSVPYWEGYCRWAVAMMEPHDFDTGRILMGGDTDANTSVADPVSLTGVMSYSLTGCVEIGGSSDAMIGLARWITEYWETTGPRGYFDKPFEVDTWHRWFLTHRPDIAAHEPVTGTPGANQVQLRKSQWGGHNNEIMLRTGYPTNAAVKSDHTVIRIRSYRWPNAGHGFGAEPKVPLNMDIYHKGILTSICQVKRTANDSTRPNRMKAIPRSPASMHDGGLTGGASNMNEFADLVSGGANDHLGVIRQEFTDETGEPYDYVMEDNTEQYVSSRISGASTQWLFLRPDSGDQTNPHWLVEFVRASRTSGFDGRVIITRQYPTCPIFAETDMTKVQDGEWTFEQESGYTVRNDQHQDYYTTGPHAGDLYTRDPMTGTVYDTDGKLFVDIHLPATVDFRALGGCDPTIGYKYDNAGAVNSNWDNHGHEFRGDDGTDISGANRTGAYEMVLYSNVGYRCSSLGMGIQHEDPADTGTGVYNYEYLTVYQIGDTSESKATQTYIDATTMHVVHIAPSGLNDRVVAFSQTETRSGSGYPTSCTYSITSSTTVEHVICELEPATSYTVTKAAVGIAGSPFTVSSEGVIEFEVTNSGTQEYIITKV